MKKLFVLLAVVCFSVVPAVTFGTNSHPTLYLEIYAGSTGRCVHAVHPGPLPGEIQCYYGTKDEGTTAYIPIHIGKLDTPPLAQGWPLPCGPGGGFDGVSYGLATSGEWDVDVECVSVTPCTGFGVGPGLCPSAIVFAASDACHDWWDHPGYVRVGSLNATPVTFSIVQNSQELALSVINCQGGLDVGRVVGGGAQWGGTKTIVCATDPTSVDLTTWGRIKGLYR
jgi:hypothetical protein